MKKIIIKYLIKILDKLSNNPKYCRDIYGNLYKVEDVDDNFIKIKKVDPQNWISVDFFYIIDVIK